MWQAGSRRWALAAAFSLLVATAALIGSAAVVDAVERRSGPESVIRLYFGGLEQLDADRAVAQIVPEARQRLTPFIENGAGNRYQIVGIAVEEPSVLAQLHGAPARAVSATIFLDITQADGVRWQAGPRVPLVRRDDRWYLGDAPLRAGGG